MLTKRLRSRDNPFPGDRPATVDDLVFLPANLSRLVIDPYREACKVATDLGFGRMDVAQPLFVSGFDNAPADVKRGVGRGVADAAAGYIGMRPVADDVPWLQLVVEGQIPPQENAAGLIHVIGPRFEAPAEIRRFRENQILGLAVSHRSALEDAIRFALDQDLDVLLVNGNTATGRDWPELTGAPDLTLMRDTIACLRRLNMEEEIDILWFGGLRSGTDAAKLIAMGAKSLVFGMTVALAAGAEFDESHRLRFAPDITVDECSRAVCQYPQVCCGRGVDDGPLHRQDQSAQPGARGPARPHTRHRRGHRTGPRRTHVLTRPLSGSCGAALDWFSVDSLPPPTDRTAVRFAWRGRDRRPWGRIRRPQGNAGDRGDGALSSGR